MTDNDLIARLRVDEPMCEEHFTANAAANRIEALVKERDALISEHAMMMMDRDDARFEIAVIRARAEQLAATNERLEAAIRELEHRWYLGDLQEKDFAAALKGDDHD